MFLESTAMDRYADSIKPFPVSESIQCRQCGYDLRGTVSEVCPECGALKIWLKLVYFDGDEFSLAVHKLEESGVLFVKYDSGLGRAGNVQLLTGQTALSEIFICKPNIKKAIEVLESSGLAIPIPLVERAEPICPTCSQQLDIDGPTICKSCNAPFCWIDIDEQEIDTTGSLCKECQYDLTGNTTKFCPECNSPIPIDLGALVDRAINNEEFQASTTATQAQFVITKSFLAIVAAVFICSPVIFATSIFFNSSSLTSLELAFGVVLSLLLEYLGIKAAISFKRMNESSKQS